jgi:hypothetical protein
MSLLLLFPSSAPATQAGFRSLTARWMGGAGGPPAQAGFFSLVARWMGGAGSTGAPAGGNRRRRFFCGS